MGEDRTVGEVMRPVAVAVGPSDTLTDALRRMRRFDVRVAPVLTGDGRVVGVLSAPDLESGRKDACRSPVTVQQVALSTAPTVRTDATVSAAALLLRGGCLPCLPVTDQSGYLLGIIGREDVAGAASGT